MPILFLYFRDSSVLEKLNSPNDIIFIAKNNIYQNIFLQPLVAFLFSRKLESRLFCNENNALLTKVVGQHSIIKSADHLSILPILLHVFLSVV